MKLDKQPPDAAAAAAAVPTDPSGKPKKWANVRRKFALIVANRNHHLHHHSHHHHPPPDEEAASQAESFCRPYIQDGGAAGLLLRAADREPDREMQYAQVTRENSERNKEITSPLYSPPTTTATTTKRKKKKGPRKIVRFIEQPYVILDQEDACSVDSREDVDVQDVDVDVMAGVKALQLRTGSGPATIRVVRQ